MPEIPQEKIRELAAAVEDRKLKADEAKEDLNSAFAAAKAKGLELGAFKSAMKLRKLDPVKLKAWLDTFDACRDALGLDAQQDLEDAIAALERAAGEDGEIEIRDGDGKTLARFGKGIRKARGRAAETVN